MEVQRRLVTSPSTHSSQVKTPEFNPGLPLARFPQHPSATPRASSPIQEGPCGLILSSPSWFPGPA